MDFKIIKNHFKSFFEFVITDYFLFKFIHIIHKI